MKLLKPEEPTVEAAVSYFVDMAQGKTAPSKSNEQNGLGAVRYPSTYHVIPSVKLVTPTAQALAAAKDEVEEEEEEEEEREVMRGWNQPGKQKRIGRSTAHSNRKKRKPSEKYLTPGLD